MTVPDGSAERLAPAARSIALVLALGGVLMTIDTTVAVVAVPAVMRDLGISLPVAQGMTTGYLLGVVAVIPVAGQAAERFGARRTYLVALSVFVVASLGAGASQDAVVLTLSRLVQGLGGGLLNPVGQAIALRAATPGTRGRLMSILGLPVAIGPVLGPPLAGWLIGALSWRWVFWINVPLGLAAIALCLLVLPRDGSARARGSGPRGVDLPGLALLSSGAVCLVLGCSLIGDAGAPTTASVLALPAGLVLLGLGAAHVRRARQPAVDLGLLRVRPMRAALALLALFGAGYFGSMAVVPLYVQGVLGRPALDAGLVMIPSSLAVGISIQVFTRRVDRSPPERIVRGGTIVAFLGAVLMLVVMTSSGGILGLIVAGVLLGGGSGATILPTMTMALRGLDDAALPRGTTLLAFTQQLASALGVAAVATTTSLLLGGVPGLRSGSTGSVERMLALGPAERERLLPELASGTGGSFLLVGLLIGASAVIAARRARIRPRPAGSTSPRRP